MFVFDRPYVVSLMLVGMDLRVEHLKGASLRQAPALLVNIRVGYKSLPGTNTLTNYQHSSITLVKYFISFVPGPDL